MAKISKLTTSLVEVTTGPEARAGSMWMVQKNTGVTAPRKAETSMATEMDRPTARSVLAVTFPSLNKLLAIGP
jgi:hypothetical protein